MPKQYDNELSGALFKNDKKESDKHPDYKGQAQVDGVEYWVSAWINKIERGEREGEKMVKLKFTAKDDDRGSKGRSNSKPSRRNDGDDF